MVKDLVKRITNGNRVRFEMNIPVGLFIPSLVDDYNNIVVDVVRTNRAELIYRIKTFRKTEVGTSMGLSDDVSTQAMDIQLALSKLVICDQQFLRQDQSLKNSTMVANLFYVSLLSTLER